MKTKYCFILLFIITVRPISATTLDSTKPPSMEEARTPKATIPSPVARRVKLSTSFTASERALDREWFSQKRKLASIFVIDRKREFASALASALNNLSDEDFTFLSTQPYMWTDLFGEIPRVFSSALSPSKLRILGDAIANRDLRSLEKNLVISIGKLIAYLDLDDPQIIEKLEAFLPAALESEVIESKIDQKARALRQKMSVAKDEARKDSANMVITKLALAKKMRIEKIMATPLPAVPPKEPEEKKPLERKRPLERTVDETPEEPPLKKQKVYEADKNWRETNPQFNSWIHGDDFDLADKNIGAVKDNLRFLLKQFTLEDATMQERMRNAFVKTMAQHNDVNRLFEIIRDSDDENDLSVFMALLQGRAGEGKETDPYLVEMLWKSEKGLIIAGASVRAIQERRLASMLNNLDEGQLSVSLNNANFWTLLGDQPKAAARGFRPDHFQQIAKYFLDNIRKDKFKPATFAKDIISQITEEMDADRVYASLLALAPVSRFVPAVESAISFKLNNLTRGLKKIHGDKTTSEMMRKLKAAMR